MVNIPNLKALNIHENKSRFYTENLFEDADRFELGMSDANDNDDSSNPFSTQSTNFSGLISFNITRWSCVLKTSRSHLANFGDCRYKL